LHVHIKPDQKQVIVTETWYTVYTRPHHEKKVSDILYHKQSVEIMAGPLTGISGELIDFTGRKRVIIRLDEIYKSMMISVPMYLLKLKD
jgi:transcription antitermination factor NusG